MLKLAVAGCYFFNQRQGLQAAPVPESANTPFVEIRLATQLISPPKKPNPPVKGLDRFVTPPGVSLDWLVEVAWDWRNTGVTPDLENSSLG